MNLNELYNENKNPFQDVVDKVAAKEKQADAEHTKGLKDIADKFQNAEKKSSKEFSKKLRADEAKDTHCSDKCCGSDVKAEDCNCPPTCKHCDCNAIVAEAQLDELTGWTQAAPKRAAPQPKKSTFAELIKKSDDKRSALQRQKDGGKKNWFAEEQGVAEGQFDPINDDDFYEYNVNTNKIVKRISGKHPIARQFSPMQKEWAGRDADHKIVKGMYAKQLKPTVDEKVSDYLPAPLVNKHSIVKGWRKAKGLDEKAPPGDKAERMVKHIKKNYSKDGKLTPTEKSIAYATAWKAHNAGKV